LLTAHARRPPGPELDATTGRGVNLDAAMMDAMRFPGVATGDELLADGRGPLDRVSPHADAFVAARLPLDLLPHPAGEIAAFDAQALARAGGLTGLRDRA
jgi:hypothetical protein